MNLRSGDASDSPAVGPRIAQVVFLVVLGISV
jgi:hypothetical protein